MAKKYLEEIEKEETSRAEEKELYKSVSQRLDDEYLDSVGKLRKKIADEFVGYDKASLKVLKHKLHKLPVTCVCLSSDNTFLFSGSKTQFVLKWNVADMKVVGSFDCSKTKSAASGSADGPDENKGGKKKKAPRQHILTLALSTDFKFLVREQISFILLI